MINPNFDSEEKEKDFSWFEEEYEKSFIDLTKEPERPKPIISIGKYEDRGKTYDNPIFTEGEFSCISAPSKTYKSFFKSHLAAIYNSGSSKYFNQIKGYKTNEFACVDIDTEQGKFHAWKTFNRVVRMADNKVTGYYPFKLRHQTPEQRVDFVDALLASDKIKETIKVVFIDGVADLIPDSNDLVMSQEIASKIMRWTDEYNMHVCVIIHNAYGSLKPTGHLGSTVVKKAETVINLKPLYINEDEFTGVIKVIHQFSRGSSFDDFHFKYDKTIGHLRECDEVGNTEEDLSNRNEFEYDNNLDVFKNPKNIEDDDPF